MRRAGNLLNKLARGRAVRTGLRAWGAALVVSLTSIAAAQQCTYEVEPNDTPAEATFLTGAGPDGAGNAANARLGTICLAGELNSGDQDAFWWHVDEEAADHQWTVWLEGIPGQVNKLSMYRIEFADNGVDVTAANELYSVQTPDGAPVTGAPVLLGPGRYMIGLSTSGGAGQYVANLIPQALNRSTTTFRPSAQSGAFRAYGAVNAQLEQPFVIAEADAGFTWSLQLETALGSSVALVLEGPDGQVGTASANSNTSANLNNYSLAPGSYVAHVVGNAPVVRLSLTRNGRVGAGQEVEPNNSRDTATLFPLGTEMRGNSEDEDWFRLDVSEAEAGSVWDLAVETPGRVTVRMFGEGSAELFRRVYGGTGAVEGLHLAAGVYYLNIRYDGSHTDYRLALSASAAPQGMNEREPNDIRAMATDLGVQAEARGLLADQDTDFFRFTVEGEAQLYRVQAVGQGVTRLIVYNGGGTEIVRTTGQGRLRLDDVLLLPGAQLMSVEGSGEYALRAIPIGPAPVQAPPANMPAATEPLSSAAAAPAEPANDEPVTGPPVVEQPVLSPPPPGLLEFEPNNDASRAHRLVPGAVHVGRLHDARDEDYYRVFLSADQLVRIELVPPQGSVSLAFDLAGEGRFAPLTGEDGQPVVMERWLEAGDHSLFVHARNLRDDVPTGYYQLRMTLLGMLEAPVDTGLNNSLETAASMPAELAWSGVVGEAGGTDYYAFPVFDEDTEANLAFTSSNALDVRAWADGAYQQVRAGEGGLYTVDLKAGQASYLYIRGSARYSVKVEFSNLPDPAQLAPARGGDALAVSLESAVDRLAAFWHEGQRVQTTVAVRNTSSEVQTVELEAAVNNVLASVDLPAGFELQPGQSVEFPVTLELPADIRDDVPLTFEVGARSATSAATARADFALLCEAPPVKPFPYHFLPSSLLGRPDVLWSGFGATIHGESSYVRRDQALIDGRTTISYGGWVGNDHSPTYMLAGNAPVTLVGTSLANQSNANRSSQLRDFVVETSLDGVNFAPVLKGRLQAAQFEQVFEFDEPVTARYARLSSPTGGYVGEWKLYAHDPSLFSGLDIARPDLGGYVVWSEPVLSGSRSNGILDPESRARSQDVRPLDGLTFVIGFNHARAALVREVVWLDHSDALAAPDQLVGMVSVEASLGGAAGPWESVAEWQLERDAAGAARLEFDEPIWARYLRFSAPKGASTYLYEPQQVSVYEAEVGTDGYLSVLAEWGNMVRSAAYELLVDTGAGAVTARTASGNHSMQTAAELQPGAPMGGTVAIGENIDWYKITVGQGQNHVTLRLAGDPTIAYLYELTDSTGRSVVYDVRSEGDDELVTFFAEPGDYYLKVEEPKRTVIFSWDTSGSVSPYIPVTYNSLASFARGVDGDREAVQLLAYNSPLPDWLLPFWSSDPLRVQRAIQEYDRRGDSSNTIVALLTGTLALQDREGTRAVLLITDAESDGYSLNPQLWRALEDVRPRVFTFEISSGGSDYAQDMMQSYAAVNGGTYEMTAGVGDFDAGFARASCLLRRPKGYEVEVALGFAAPPGPGMLSVVPSPGAAQVAVQIVFDASGSMGQVLPSGEQRIAAAKRALETLVGEVLPEGTPFALRAFGHVTPASCETRLDVPFGELDRAKALAAVAAIEPKLLSGTPIAESLALVAQDLSRAQGGRQVILITDGEESCGGDPAEAVRQLREAGPVSLAIVSLALEPDALAVFEALAQEVGASYVDVGSYEALSAAIVEALNPAFEVYDQEGALVAEGRVGGEAVELPMGVYRVRVLSAPVEVFDNVRVPGDGSVTVNAGR